jgi:hypothetical protein
MVALSEVPLNSEVWLLGAAACFMLCYRSFANYRRSANELSKYLAWFGVLMGCGQSLLAIPAFFTLDPGSLRTTYLSGEFFIYSSSVAQAAILWCLILRSHLSIRAVTVPVGLLGLVSWLYALPLSTLRFSSSHFINYRDPAFSTAVIGLVLISLFVPVGIYFLRSATKQVKPKAILTSLALGLVYVGVGFFTGGLELVAGQVITPKSAIGDLAFFGIMLAVLAWPRREKPMLAYRG